MTGLPMIRLSSWPVTLIACLVLSACTTVGPDFKRPAVPWLDSWSGGSLETTRADAQPHARAPTENWWRNFNDPALDQLIAEAQRLNHSVRTAGLRILEARAQLGIAGSALYPQVQQVTANAARVGKNQSEGADSAFSTYSLGLGVGWELDFWGKFQRGIEAADANYFASIAQYDDVQVLVASQVANLYSSIRTIELRLRIAHENAALQQRSLEITERLFNSGNESELDVQQAKALYLSTLSTIPELEATLRQSQNALSVLLARPPGPLPEMAAGTEQIPQASLAVIVDIPADLLRRRPDVRAAEMQLAAQSALIGVSAADLYPSISLLGSAGLSATSLDWSARSVDWAAGSGLVWNVFDHGRLENQVLVQDARFQQLYEVYQDTILRAARELDDAAVAFAKSRIQITFLDAAVQAAQRSLDIATIQYREGLVDFQRVLDSQRTLFSQQERLVASRGNVTLNLIALYKALGGGWETGRSKPVLDTQTNKTMRERSKWKGLLDAPLPPAPNSAPDFSETRPPGMDTP